MDLPTLEEYTPWSWKDIDGYGSHECRLRLQGSIQLFIEVLIRREADGAFRCGCHVWIDMHDDGDMYIVDSHMEGATDPRPRLRGIIIMMIRWSSDPLV